MRALAASGNSGPAFRSKLLHEYLVSQSTSKTPLTDSAGSDNLVGAGLGHTWNAAGVQHPDHPAITMNTSGSNSARYGDAQAPFNGYTEVIMAIAFKNSQNGFLRDFVDGGGSSFIQVRINADRSINLQTNQQDADWAAGTWPSDTTTWHTAVFFITDGSIRFALDGVEQTASATDFVGDIALTGMAFALGGTSTGCRAHIGDFMYLDPATATFADALAAESDIASRYTA